MTNDPKNGERAGIPRASILLLACALLLIGHEAWIGGDGDSTGTPPAARAPRIAGVPTGTPPPGGDSRTAPSRGSPFAGWLAPVDRAPPSIPAPPKIDEVRLQGIVHDPSDREATFAVISGWAFRAGERVGDRCITAIEPDRVILDDGTELRAP